jgi:hypothetical protein
MILIGVGRSFGYLLDSDGVTGLGAKVIQQLNDTLVAVLVLTERVDNPDLSQVHSSSESGRLLVTRDELDILNTTSLFNGSAGWSMILTSNRARTYVRDSKGAENLLSVQVPKTESVGVANTQGRLQDGDRLHEVRSKNELLLPVNAETVGRELLA